MNKIIPFSKDIHFKDKIGEIESIKVEDQLIFEEAYSIKGELLVVGTNKNNEVSNDFNYPLPVEIAIDTKYDTSKASVKIDDFFYEIINDDILRVNIDLCLDNLFYQNERNVDFDIDITKKKDLLDANIDINSDDKKLNINFEKDNSDKLEASLEKGSNNQVDLFKELPDNKEYSIYREYTFLEKDTIDDILTKYNISKEELELYNDLDNLVPGMKLIIPSVDE